MIREFLIKKFYNIGFNCKVNIKSKFYQINKHKKNKFFKLTFGEKFKKKNFLIIKRHPGAGFFSNFLYVLSNLDYANKNKLIPIVDMENFPTMYNEKKNLHNKKNVWELYFTQPSNYKLKDIYKSKNVFISYEKMKINLNFFKKIKYKYLFDKYLRVNKNILKKTKIFKNKYFKNKKVLGIHFRGTDQKISAGHTLPPTIFEIEKIINDSLKKKKYDLIFLVTEELEYFLKLKKKFGDYICSYDVFRGNNTKDFNSCKRKFHRNYLGIENLLEAITLSYCEKIVYCETNISLFSIFYSNFKIKRLHLDKGFKSDKIYLSIFQWYIKYLIPHFIKSKFN